MSHRVTLLIFVVAAAACGPSRPAMMDGGASDLGPLGLRPCDPVPIDAGTPPDLGPPQACFGTPMGSCSAFTPATCSMGIGCSVTQCHGFPVGCDTLGSMTTCMAQSGCAWSGTSCIGTPAACAMFGDMTACGNHSGCVWSPAMMTCGGLLTPCNHLDATQCAMQPGCTTTDPDMGSPFADAGSPTCRPCAGTASIDVTVVKSPDPVLPFPRALIHLESTCGGSRDVMTGMDGSVHLDLDRTMGSWTLTAAAPGYSAVSIVGISELDGFGGDIRLDPVPFPMGVTVPASGTVTGGTPGAMVQVDCPDFATTIAMPGGAWSASYYVFPWTVPLRFSALELDSTGRAVNAVFSEESLRTPMPHTGLSLTLPSPAVTPITTTVHAHFPTTGELTAMDAMPNGGSAQLVYDLYNDPYLYVGSVTFPVTATDFNVSSFSALPPTAIFVSWLGPTALLNLRMHDITATDVTIPEITMPTIAGSTLGDAIIGVPALADWEFVQIDLGEGPGVPPGWRIVIPLDATTSSSVAIPHLPAGVTTSMLMLDPMSTGSVNALPLLLKMHRGRAWSTQASSSPIDDWAMSAGGVTAMLGPAGR